jgi:hypothetical protein
MIITISSYVTTFHRHAFDTRFFYAHELGWDEGGPAPERSGFLFEMLKPPEKEAWMQKPPTKQPRH